MVGINSAPHVTRHTWATDALRAGAAPLTVAKQLGHSTTEMLERYYAHIPTEELHNAQALRADWRANRTRMAGPKPGQPRATACKRGL
jgi:integrase